MPPWHVHAAICFSLWSLNLGKVVSLETTVIVMTMTFNLICQCMYMVFDIHYFFGGGGNNSSVNQQYNVILSITVNGQENESRMVI